MPEGKIAASAHRPPREAERSGKTGTKISDVQRRTTRLNQTTLLLATGAIVALGVYLLVYVLQARAWQLLVESGIVVVALASAAVAYGLARQGKLDAAGFWALFGIVIAYGGGELLLANATLYFAVGGVLLIILVGNMVLPRIRIVWLTTAGLFGAYAWLVNRFEPLPRYDIRQSSLLNLVTASVTLLIVLVILWQIVRAFRIGTIRTRLLISFVAIALLLPGVLAVGGIMMSSQSGQQHAINLLESVALLKEAEINTWVHDLQSELAIALAGEYDMQHASVLLPGSPPPASRQEAYDYLQGRLNHLIEQTQRFEELFLMDMQGQVILSTDVTQEGKIYRNKTYFRRGLEGSYVHPPSYSPSLGQVTIVAVHPLIGKDGQLLGVLAGRASLARLSEIMGERAGLGETGETYLIGANHVLLTELRSGEERVYVRTQGANEAIENRAGGSGLYKDYRGESVIGTYRWLPELQVALLAEQEEVEATSVTRAVVHITGGAATAAVLIAVVASLFITRSIAAPLASLAETATQIAAGDLDLVAEVKREDEIRTLAQAFNSMTAQLRGLIGSLEQRVADRTHEVERRSAYLEASAEVGRAATSILETGQLVRQVVELIRERFGLYYVGLFLVDASGEWAVLQAGTGEAGQAMLARGHRLKVGTGMIGWSVAHAQARVALEVGEDAVRLATAELPDTRSEAALPLRSRGQVVGALTVQSNRPGAFDEAAIAVLQTMADQVAVALDNARLLTESQAALEAERRAYGKVSREAWERLLRARPNLGQRYDPQSILPPDGRWREEMRLAMQEGETVLDKGKPSVTLATPIKVRGHVIGVIDAHKPNDADEWTPEQITLLETLTGQLGVALESARLYQDTQRRAARERLTREITDKMRRATDVDGIVQTVVDELFNVLGASRTFARLGATPSAQETKVGK